VRPVLRGDSSREDTPMPNDTYYVTFPLKIRGNPGRRYNRATHLMLPFYRE